MTNVSLRKEAEGDFSNIDHLLQLAFEGSEEVVLVQNIRISGNYIGDLSLVAVSGNEVLGHAMISLIEAQFPHEIVKTLALAPVAVLPVYQQKGIGTLLVNKLVEVAKDLNFTEVFVLGDPKYYGRVGFEPSVKWNVPSPFKVKPEYFMALELNSSDLLNAEESATLVYPSYFTD